MTVKDRLIEAKKYLIGAGIIDTQLDIARIMDSNKASVSRAFSGDEKYLTKNFVHRFNDAFGGIFNTDYILRGQGELLRNWNTATADNSLDTMSMDKKDMLSAIIQHFSAGNKAQFAKMVGVTPQTISTWLSRNTFDADKIFAFCKGINGDWLLSGKGDMLKGSGIVAEPSKDGTGIPLIPVDAMAGYFAGEQTVLLQECDRYVVPAFRNADFLIHVRGDSMIPHYYSGDMVACKMLSLVDIFFQWGKVYVINTDQGALIKKVEPGTTDDSITLVSDNEKYKPFEISRRSIYQIAIVIGVIRAE